MSLKMMEQKLLDWIDFLAPVSYQLKNSLQIITTRLTGGLHQGYKPKLPASA